MSGRLAVFWLPRVLFWAALLVSLFLILAVILSPLLEGTDLLAQCGRIQALFARDSALRRTTVASALGLLVTACIFFRSTAPAPEAAQRRRGPRVPPPPTMAGA